MVQSNFSKYCSEIFLGKREGPEEVLYNAVDTKFFRPHQKKVLQPEFFDKKYITSFLFKLKSKAAALYQALGGFAINGINLTKLQSYPEQNSFETYFFLCDLDGHIEDPRVQKSLEELGLHCQDFHVLGVFEADKFREK